MGIENRDFYHKRCDLDITPDSHDYPTKKSMVLVWRMNVSILGIKGSTSCFNTMAITREGGGGVLPYKGLMGTCGQPGYVFRDFCLEQGIEFIIFCLNQGIDLSIFVFINWVKCLKQGIKNRNSVLKWVGKSAIFVLNKVRV